MELTQANEKLSVEAKQRALAEGESAKLRRIVEGSWNEIFMFDAETYRFTHVNQGALANMGYSMEEMCKLTAYDIKPGFDCNSFMAAVKPLLDGTEQALLFETVHERKDRSAYPVEVRLQLLADENPPVFFAVINDITKRKHAEDALREMNESLERRVEARTLELKDEVASRKREEEARAKSEARMRAILDTAADGIVTIDEEGRILGFNTAAETMFGVPADKAIGESVAMLMPQDHAEQHDDCLAGNKTTGFSKFVGGNGELTGIRQDGSKFPIEISISETSIGDDTIYMGIVRDISDRKQSDNKLLATLEELRSARNSLVESEKMASLGNLVAGIAHEINTPLGIGVTASSHMREMTDQFVKRYRSGNMKRADLDSFVAVTEQSVDILESNLHRASELVRSFKQVAVDQSDDSIRSFALKEYVEEILRSLQPKFKNRNIDVDLDIDPQLSVTSKPGALAQIVTNLVVNSLIHGFENSPEGNIRIAAHLNGGGKEVDLDYSDDGKGMDTQTVGQIFDPFFTTKRGHGGSGLGMHILFNIVTQSLGGQVSCDSEPGSGTHFNITFPQEIVLH